MLSIFDKFSKSDLAKYPFLREAADYVKMLDISIEELTSSEYVKVLERAEERIQEAIFYAIVTRKLGNEEIELLSFPTAMLLVAATNIPFIKRRYALAEAKQAYNDLKGETREKILAIARDFQWNIIPTENEGVTLPYEFKIHFTNYLKNTTHLKGKKWKLINKPLLQGYVYLTRSEVARLLSEEIRKHIENKLEIEKTLKLPKELAEKVEKIKNLMLTKVNTAEIEGMPGSIKKEAFPPCIAALYEAASKGRQLSHVGRFTLTSFLLNIGLTQENVIEIFRSFPDFNERITRYQVEHISGERGSRTRYLPPSCKTLETHGICINPGEECKGISHPIAFYKRKVKSTS
ncbi:MAG: DNA primase large subunit PriL [Candidatus Bathyarchaeia archaeon]